MNHLKQLTVVVGLLTLIVSLGFIGCAKKSTGPGTTDDEQIKKALGDNRIESYQAICGDDSIGIDESSGLLRWSVEQRELLGFRRKIPSQLHERTIFIKFITSNSAIATIRHTLSGNFLVYTTDGVDTIAIEEDNAVRQVELIRTRSTTAPYRGWEITGITVLEGYSQATPPGIDSVRVTGTELDTLITDTEIFLEKDIFTFAPRESVTVRVWTDATTYLVFLHWPVNKDTWLHKQMEALGDGCYQSGYYTPADTGHYSTFVDVISSSAFEEDGSYAARAWGMPYYVKE